MSCGLESLGRRGLANVQSDQVGVIGAEVDASNPTLRWLHREGKSLDDHLNRGVVSSLLQDDDAPIRRTPMKPIAAFLAGVASTGVAHAFQYCIVQPNYTCITDTGRTLLEHGEHYVDPSTRAVVMHIPRAPLSAREVRQPGPPAHGYAQVRYLPPAGRPEPEPVAQQPARRSPNLPSARSPAIAPSPSPPIVNPHTGEVLNPAAGGYVGSKDGRFYSAPSGAGGIVDTTTGRFIPSH